MGFLNRLVGGSDEGEEDRGAREARQTEDVARLEAGGIPLSAEQRIAELGSGSRGFNSGLSVSAFALTREEGIRPIAQVMGSSVYKVGFRNYPWGTGWGNATLTELKPLTHAWNEARRLALDRMRQEAEAAGCHAVVDVKFNQHAHGFLDDDVEILVNGTAVHLPERVEPGAPPVLTDLSMADFVLLRRGGYRPVGVVASTSVFYIVPSRQTRRLTTGWQRFQPNQELPDFTQGVYEARERALTRATRQGEQLGAAGLVGVDVKHHVAVRRVGSESNEREDLIVTFHILGTAIAERAEHTPIEPQPILRLGGRRP